MNSSSTRMGRRAFLGSLAGAAVAATLPHAQAQVSRPNILFIFTDDHAAHSISAYGSRINQTPNLDRIGAAGVRFDRCLVTNSVCAPSRAVVLTGKHSFHNGQRTNGDTFDGSQETFPKLLRAAGYTTALIGKWHLKSTPTGFDHYEILYGQGDYYNAPMERNGQRVEHVGYVTDIITDLSIKWIEEERDKSKPFLLMYQHKAPHGRWEPALRHLTLYEDVEIPEPETLFDDYSGRTTAASQHEMGILEHLDDFRLMINYSSKFTPEQHAVFDAHFQPQNEAFLAKRDSMGPEERTRWQYQRWIKNYLRTIAAVDENVGRVLDYLEESGLSENTVVIYSSDQGFYLGDHGWFDKRWMYEQSLRMPLLVRWPGVAKAGTANADLVSNLDFAPTFLDMAGVTPPEAMQGESLVPLLKGERPTDWRTSFYYRYYRESGGHGVAGHDGVRTARHKLIYFHETKEWELYDLEQDPNELKSVYDSPEYATVRAALHDELDRLRTYYDAPPPGE
jgi:arylsulfatase A-like enzyme